MYEHQFLFFVKDHHATLNTSIITYVTVYYYTIYLLIFLQYLLLCDDFNAKLACVT
jgi:hypothetical protein